MPLPEWAEEIAVACLLNLDDLGTNMKIKYFHLHEGVTLRRLIYGTKHEPSLLSPCHNIIVITGEQ